MGGTLQFLNQHALLLAGGGALIVPAVVLGLWRASRGWWAAWAVLGLALTGTFFALRTPAATLSSFEPAVADEPAAAEAEPAPVLVLVHEEIAGFDSVEAIRAKLAASAGKPTLVDFYADFGFG